MKFYGRDQEIAALTNELRLAETSSRLAVITGRRRVGKTKLILKVAEESGRPMLYFLGRIRESSLNRPPCAREAQFGTRSSVRTLPSW